jgi:hypothetical protein
MTTEMAAGGPVEVGGIPVADGTHLCVLYRGRAERDELLMPYLRGGLRRGDVCLCVTSPGESSALAPLVAEGDLQLQTLQVLEPGETYLRTGVFEPDSMVEMLQAWSEQIFAEKPSGFARVAADMSWAAPLVSPGFVTELMGFESRVTRWLQTYPQMGMCLYDLDVFGGDVVVQAVRFHPQIWMSGAVVHNPYYVRPD